MSTNKRLNLQIKKIVSNMKDEERQTFKSSEMKLLNLIYHKQQRMMSGENWLKN